MTDKADAADVGGGGGGGGPQCRVAGANALHIATSHPIDPSTLAAVIDHSNKVGAGMAARGDTKTPSLSQIANQLPLGGTAQYGAIGNNSIAVDV